MRDGPGGAVNPDARTVTRLHLTPLVCVLTGTRPQGKLVPGGAGDVRGERVPKRSSVK
jgi:hypothetical protein